MPWGYSKKTIMSLCCIFAVLCGCGAERARLDTVAAGWTDEIIVRGIEYSDKGLPLVPAPLAKRPSAPGDRFTVVRLREGRPAVSCDIAVARQKPDFVQPFRTVYAWTGRGFREGASSTGALSGFFTEGESHVQLKEATVLEMAIVVTPVTIGTVGGFVVGLADGIRQTALEASKVVVNGEEAVTCTTYQYDHAGRLMYMHMYTPDQKQELVRTEYWYEDDGTVPARTAVKSLAEGKEREIK